MLYKYSFFLVLFSLIVLGAGPRLAGAQEESPVVSEKTVQETLPGDGLGYHWERFMFGLRRAFVFNAEKKAALYEEQLARLDHKSDACAEIGDEECLERIRERSEALQERAARHAEKKEALLAKHLEHLMEWRAQHAERLEKLQEQAAQRRDQREEWQAVRKERRHEMRQNVQEHVEQRKENVIQRHENKQENREQLIELRSHNLQNKLDATEQRVETHNKSLRENPAAE